MYKVNYNCGLLAMLHMLVDALCCCSLFLMAPDLDAMGKIVMFVVYNCVAFLTQPLTGILVDWSKCRFYVFVASILFLLFGGIMCVINNTIYPIVVSVIIGFGNSLFHVYGGKYVAVHTHNDIRYLGVFVSTGALGLFLGGRYASSFTLYIILSFILLASALLIYNYRGADIAEKDVLTANVVRHNRFLSIDRNTLILFSSILFIVFFRSFIGKMVPSSTKELALFPVMACVLAVLGKSSGGFLALRWGIGNTLFVTLLLSLIFYMFGQHDEIFLLVMILFANLSMPVTLYLANRCMPKFEGFAFGMIAAFLIPGYALGLVCVDNVLAFHLICPLFATIIIEELVLLACGERRLTVLGFAVLINILTNLPLNLFVRFADIRITYTTIAILEFTVVVVEMMLYFVLTRDWRKSLLYSVLCNTISYLIGFAFQSFLTVYLY